MTQDQIFTLPQWLLHKWLAELSDAIPAQARIADMIRRELARRVGCAS